MKRFLKVVILSILAVFLLQSPSLIAFAEESSGGEEELRSQVDSMLEDYDIGFSYDDMAELSLDELALSLWDVLAARIKAPMKLLGIILMIVIFISFMKNLGETAFPDSRSANLYNLVCVLAAVAAVTPTLLDVYHNSADAMQTGGAFMLVFVPIYAGITILSGGITSGGIYNAVALGAAELMVQLGSNVIMPLLTMTAALAISGSVFPNSTLDSITGLIRKVITWGLTVSVTLFTGFISLKSTLGNSVDGFASKTVKFVVSGMIPIVGSAVTDAYAAVKGSFSIMRCTAGTAGTVAVILIILPPILELAVFRFVMWTSRTAAEMFSVTPLEKLFRSLDNGLAIAMSVMICFGVLFIISTAILMKGAG